MTCYVMTQSPPPQAGDLIPSDQCRLSKNRISSTFYYVSVLIIALTVALKYCIEGEEDLVGI